jgi:hypothetical protein
MNEKQETITVETEAPPKSKNAAALVQIGERGIMLRSLEDLLRFARLAVSGGAAPEGMSDGAAAIAIQAGLEVGLGPLGGLRFGTVVNGHFGWNGQGAAALIRNSPVCKQGTLKFSTEGEGENRKGVATAWRVGYGEPTTVEYTVKDAKQAELWGQRKNWRKFPNDMLMWRALGKLNRVLFSDVTGGFPLAEEAVDFEPLDEEKQEKPPITAKPEPAPPSKPDALLEALEITPKTEEVVEAEVVEEEKTEEVQHANGGGKAAPPPSEGATPSCQHGSLNIDFCEECSKEADAALAVQEA